MAILMLPRSSTSPSSFLLILLIPFSLFFSFSHILILFPVPPFLPYILIFFLVFSVLRLGFTTQRCQCQPPRRERIHTSPLGILPRSNLVCSVPYRYKTKTSTHTNTLCYCPPSPPPSLPRTHKITLINTYEYIPFTYITLPLQRWLAQT